MSKKSAQKFIARNRAPRVQIEYDVEVYGSEKKIQIPFVMGVLSDLSGKPVDPLEPLADRKFLEIDVDNFDSRMKSMKPRVAFSVPNKITGEGNMQVDITFDQPQIHDVYLLCSDGLTGMVPDPEIAACALGTSSRRRSGRRATGCCSTTERRDCRGGQSSRIRPRAIGMTCRSRW